MASAAEGGGSYYYQTPAATPTSDSSAPSSPANNGSSLPASSSSSSSSPSSSPSPASTSVSPSTSTSISTSTSTSISTSTSTSPHATTATASTHSAEAAKPVKRGRRSNPKVKTGCSNCKQRRIKCDEKRPACSQCIRSKKICTGYPPPSRSARPAIDVRIAPKPILAAAQQHQHQIQQHQIQQQQPQPEPQPLLQPAPYPVQNAPATASLLLRAHSVVLPPRRANRRRRQVNPVLAGSPTPAIHQPANGLALKHTEGLYFELFRVQTASELSGYFNSTFWTQRVLQECHYEPAIRHAVVALGALYKTLEQSCEPDSAPMPGAMSRLDSVMCHWHVAVRQYSEACKLLATGGNLSTNRTRLMASVLLACFDSFIGDHKQAIVQIQTGLGLLERIQDEQGQGPLPIPHEQVEEDLLVIFTRLAIQAKSYDMAFHFPQPYVIRLGPQGWRDPSAPVSTRGSPSALIPSLPHRFESLREARLASDKLCEMLIRFIEHLQLAKTEAGYTLPASWRQYGATFQSQIDAWSSAFEPIFRSRLAPGMNLLEKSGIAALKMFQINTHVLFLMMFCNAEVQFDAFLPHFKAIVSLGWEVVGDDEKRAAAQRCPDPSLCRHQHQHQHQHQHEHGISKGAFRAGKYATHHIKPSFSADLGIVPPLYVVATKCREPTVRRQAIQLLRSSARREGMWDSELSANISQWVMEMEESEDFFSDAHATTQAQLPNRAIPEERRVMVQAVDFDLRSRFAELKVGTRGWREGMHDRLQRATRIKW